MSDKKWLELDPAALLAVRQVLMVGGVALATYGGLSSAQVETVIGLASTVIVIAWQWYNRSKAT